MEKWLKRKDPGDPPTPNKKSTVAASVAINNVEKSRQLKKPSPPSVTTTTVMPSTATMTVLPPNSLHLILPRKKAENRRGTSSNSILNGTSTNSSISTSTSSSISSVPAAMSTITPSVLTMSKEAVLKPIGSVLQATADKSDAVMRNVHREVVENISVQRPVASAGSALSLSSIRPSQSLPASKIDTILKNRLDARLGKSEIQNRATPSFLPFAVAQRSTILHNQRDKEKEMEKEKELKVADQSEQYENECQVGGVASSRVERVAVTSKARGMDAPQGKGKGVSSALQQSERRVLSERNDRQVDDIVFSDSSDDEGGAVTGSKGRDRGGAVSEVIGDTHQRLHEIVDLPPSTADNLSKNTQPSCLDMMEGHRSADQAVETASTGDSDNHSHSHSNTDGHTDGSTGAGKMIDDDCVIVRAAAHNTIENGMIGFEEVTVERIPNIHAWTGLTAQEQEQEEGVRGEVEGEGDVEILEDTITAWDDNQDEDNNGGRLFICSPGCTTTGTGTGTVLDLTLTPAHIPGILGSLPIGAEDILSDLIAIRQQTLDDFIIAGGQKIKRAAAYARNVPYPFIRDPAHYCGPMKFLNRLSFQGKVR